MKSPDSPPSLNSANYYVHPTNCISASLGPIAGYYLAEAAVEITSNASYTYSHSNLSSFREIKLKARIIIFLSVFFPCLTYLQLFFSCPEYKSENTGKPYNSTPGFFPSLQQ